MNIVRITLCNFGGVSDQVHYSFDGSLVRVPRDNPAIFNGIRYILDSSFRYHDESSLSPQYVEMEIKCEGEDPPRCLQIKRLPGEDPDHVLVGDSKQPINRYFLELPTALVALDNNWYTTIRSLSKGELMQWILRPEVYAKTLWKANEDPSSKLEWSKFNSFLNLRGEQFSGILNRHDLIRRSQSMEKYRNRILKNDLKTTVKRLTTARHYVSELCKDLERVNYQVNMDMIWDQKLVSACSEIRASEYYCDGSSMGVVALFRTKYDQILAHGKSVYGSLKRIYEERQRSIRELARQTANNPGSNSKILQLEAFSTCLEIMRLSEIPSESLQEERRTLGLIHANITENIRSTAHETKTMLRVIDKDMEEFNSGIRQDAPEALNKLETDAANCKSLAKTLQQLQVDKINLGCQLLEIKDFLCLNNPEEFRLAENIEGLFNLMRMLECEEFREVKQNEFLGPVFQWIHFKEDIDIMQLRSVRNQLLDWFFVILVKSSRAAHQLTKAFNERRLKGFVTFLPCDGYRQRKPGVGQSNTLSLVDMIEIDEDHPLKNFFASIIISSRGSEMDIEEDRGIIQGGGWKFMVSGELELWLQKYYQVLLKLIDLETIDERQLIDGPNQDMQVQCILLDEEYSRLLSQFNERAKWILNQLSFVQDKLDCLSSYNRTQKKIAHRMAVNATVLGIIQEGLREKSFYEQQILDLCGQSNTASPSSNHFTVEPNNIEFLRWQLAWNMAEHLGDGCPHFTGMSRNSFIYVDMDFPINEKYQELWMERFDNDRELTQTYNRYWKLTRTMAMLESAIAEFPVDTRKLLSIREYAEKTAPELELELKRFQHDYNVYPKSSTNTRHTKMAKRLCDIRQSFQEQTTDPKVVAERLTNFLAREKSTMKIERIGQVFQLVKEFYMEICYRSVHDIVIVGKLPETDRVLNAYLNTDDITAFEVVFNTDEGNQRLEEMGEDALDVFAVAVIFAKMKVNNIKVVLIEDTGTIDSELMERILKLFQANAIQVVVRELD